MITVYGANATVEDLRAIPLVRPENAGGVWQGVQHGEFADTLMDLFEVREWKVGETKWAVGGDGADLAGGIDFESVPGLDPIDGVGYSLGFLHNNRRTKSMRMYVGGRVAICSNGLATGEIILKRKHTKHFNLRDEVDFALDDYVFRARKMSSSVERMKERDLTEAEAEHLILEAGRNDLMAWSRLADVDREYRQPRFEEFGDGTSWTMMNAYTQVVKRNPVARQAEQIKMFGDLLPLAV